MASQFLGSDPLKPLFATETRLGQPKTLTLHDVGYPSSRCGDVVIYTWWLIPRIVSGL